MRFFTDSELRVIGEPRRDASRLLATFLSCELLDGYDNLGSARWGDQTGQDANGTRSKRETLAHFRDDG